MTLTKALSDRHAQTHDLYVETMHSRSNLLRLIDINKRKAMITFH